MDCPSSSGVVVCVLAWKFEFTREKIVSDPAEVKLTSGLKLCAVLRRLIRGGGGMAFSLPAARLFAFFAEETSSKPSLLALFGFGRRGLAIGASSNRSENDYLEGVLRGPDLAFNNSRRHATSSFLSSSMIGFGTCLVADGTILSPFGL